MNTFKLGDKVRAVKRCSEGMFKKGDIMQVEKVDSSGVETACNKYATFDEIELIESEPTTQNPFPTFEEFMDWVYKDAYQKDIYQNIYNYFAQFGVREVFPEVGKEYEFSEDGENWIKDTFESYESNNSIGFTHIRPIQPSRLEQLKAKHPNLTQEEQAELLHLLLTQNKQNK
jgi:hypothetical protein